MIPVKGILDTHTTFLQIKGAPPDAFNDCYITFCSPRKHRKALSLHMLFKMYFAEITILPCRAVLRTRPYNSTGIHDS